MSWIYNFPRCTKGFCDRNQLYKIKEELDETMEAYRYYLQGFDPVQEIDDMEVLKTELAFEALNIIHATETFLRGLEVFGVNLDEVKEEVIEDNKKRGYYKDYTNYKVEPPKIKLNEVE